MKRPVAGFPMLDAAPFGSAMLIVLPQLDEIAAI
jgi:hypothetical protein